MCVLCVLFFPCLEQTDNDEYTFHKLVSHPTPPAFDQPFLYNVQRNADEIRLWIDYLDVNAVSHGPCSCSAYRDAKRERVHTLRA